MGSDDWYPAELTFMPSRSTDAGSTDTRDVIAEFSTFIGGDGHVGRIAERRSTPPRFHRADGGPRPRVRCVPGRVRPGHRISATPQLVGYVPRRWDRLAIPGRRSSAWNSIR
jgi:hypothetical protein